MAEVAPLSKAVELIFAWMDRTGGNRSTIARACDLTAGTMSRICSGERQLPDFVAARKLRDGIGIPLDAWFEPASKAFQRKLLAAA